MSKNFRSQFEFGYLIGYSNCTHKTYRKPHFFYWSIKAQGADDCGVGKRRIKARTYSRFTVSDKNGNEYWGATFNRRDLLPDGIKVDFARGRSAFAVERGARKDAGTARFRKLLEFHPGGPRWSRWDHLRKAADTDPGYRLKRINRSTGYIVRQ